MPWKSPNPKDNGTEKEKGNFLREIWTRAKFGVVTMAPSIVGAGGFITYLVAPSGGDFDSNVTIGLRVGQPVFVSWPSAPPDRLAVDAYCVTADTLSIRFINNTGGNLQPPAGAYSFFGMVI